LTGKRTIIGIRRQTPVFQAAKKPRLS